MTDNASARHTPAADRPQLGPLVVHSTREGETHTISLTGELDLSNADEVERELVDVAGAGVRTILLDLSGLEFIDTSGIRLLIGADRRSRDNGHRLVLRRPPGHVMRVLRIAGIAQRLSFTD